MTVNGGDFASNYQAGLNNAAGSGISLTTGKLSDASTIFMGKSQALADPVERIRHGSEV